MMTVTIIYQDSPVDVIWGHCTLYNQVDIPASSPEGPRDFLSSPLPSFSAVMMTVTIIYQDSPDGSWGHREGVTGL